MILPLLAILCFPASAEGQARANLAVFYAVGEIPKGLEQHNAGTIGTTTSWRLRKGWRDRLPLGEGDFFTLGSERYRFLRDGWILLEPIYVETCVDALPARRLDDLLKTEDPKERSEVWDMWDNH